MNRNVCEHCLGCAPWNPGPIGKSDNTNNFSAKGKKVTMNQKEQNENIFANQEYKSAIW